MSERYLIPSKRHRVEEEIKRSRFITTVAYTPTVKEARAFIADVCNEFENASHNCWAHVIGAPGSTGQAGMSDDGEPHGTAGRPMLTVLLHSGIGDISAVVTRYFGGTLLGKGGLVKAYSGGVKLALEELPLAEHVPSVELLLVFGYSHVTMFRRLISDFEVKLRDEDFGVDVTIRLKLPLAQAKPFSAAMIDMTKGEILIEIERSDEA
ncbi:YigZ family protein [Chloroflexi bacterium TSY]|nr:YigZ family protein [Chloroflexi bacterium TSY]